MIFLQAPALASEGGGTQAPRTDPDLRQAWFVTTADPDEIDAELAVASDWGTKTINLSRRHLSAPVGIPPRGSLQVLHKPGPAIDPDSTGPHVLVEVNVPADVRRALIVLTPSAPRRDGDENEFMATVADLSDFHGGDWMFVNASDEEVGVQVGSRKFRLPPGDSWVHPAAEGQGAAGKQMEFQLSRIVEDEWKLIGASTVIVTPRRQELCFFGTRAKGKRLEYFGITMTAEP